MDMRFRAADYGTLFSAATTPVAPTRQAVTARLVETGRPTPGLRLRVRRLLDEAVSRLLVWHERARQRRALSSFDDHMLRDLGLSRADVESEVGKHFWRP